MVWQSQKIVVKKSLEIMENEFFIKNAIKKSLPKKVVVCLEDHHWMPPNTLKKSAKCL